MPREKSSHTIGWTAEADHDLRVERFDVVCRERQAGCSLQAEDGRARQCELRSPSSASRSGSRSRRGARRRVLTRLHSTLALRERQLPARRDREAQAGAALLGGEKRIESRSWYLGGIEYDK